MAGIKTRIEQNLQRVRQNIAAACIKANRSPGEITIIAVTKSADLDAIKAILELGLTNLGESRVKQMSERAAEIAAYLEHRGDQSQPRPRWHMIGHLQRNKVKQTLEAASVIHSVDSLRLAEEINDRSARQNTVTDVLLQVNCSQEPQKHGCAVGAATYLAELISTLSNVRLVGMMTMAEVVQHPNASRQAFSLLRELFDELKHNHIGGEGFRHLSMGMSQDFGVAIEEGATMVRIGTALFE
jgi:pyridoxal phosphate enzyme (YggS family)